MKVERVVVDTNVLLSASISPKGTAALLGKADVLVSGDSDLLDLGSVDGLVILSPRECWERLQH